MIVKTTFWFFAFAVGGCLAINTNASDQYFGIVVTAKMFAKVYSDKCLFSENLSRCLKDSGTDTSVFIHWNTCGAEYNGVIVVSVIDYAFYAVFN